MIIEDIYGNIITNPNLQKGKLEKAQRDGNTIYIYFTFNEDEQEAFNEINKENITQDQANCEIYESTKETITYTNIDPFCYSYSRRLQRDELTIQECPQELRERIEEITYKNGDCKIISSASNCKLVDLQDSYKRGSSFNFVIVPRDDCRLPYYEEFEENIIVIAKTDDGTELTNFFTDNCKWEEEDRYAYVNVNVPSNCAEIDCTIKCIKE